ncbi:hypothetical protein SAMN05421827_105119 [Pedobacter terrae]|uniref:Uncharacterized protein n=1 Tax=Pedobacter terrae TaxID=405671 RepID=A0A1G7T9E5_9SPHI|nr:hypothetical protein [Pedobacter terrae]SDG31841.1 hypothetical protein SAMN05421827_105119 [Pedobacter terrae]
MAKLFQVKLRLFEPDKPNVRFKPALTTALVKAKTKAEAEQKAKDQLLVIVRKQFTTADAKIVNSISIPFTHYFK